VISFERPWALALLAVPVLVAWLAARAARARETPTGTLEVWREVEASSSRAAERRRTWSWPLALLVSSLAAAALALAGPRDHREGSAAPWCIVVDRSPSMYLPREGSTRLDAALRAVREITGGGEATWCVESDEFIGFARAAHLPDEWREPPRGAWREPRWELFDAPGTLWVTDVAPGVAPRAASVVASGAEPQPGLVAELEDELVEWNGAALVRTPRAEPKRRTFFIAPNLRGTPIGRAALAWSRARRFDATDEPADAALAILDGGIGEARPVECSHEAWTLRGTARELWLETPEPASTLLECGGVVVARTRAGAIDLALSEIAEPQGDSTAFALFWAEAFDESTLGPRGVSLEERQRSGAPLVQRGLEPSSSLAAPPAHFDAWLALAAAALALAALAARYAPFSSADSST